MALCFCCAVCGAAVLVFVDVLYSTEYVFIRTTGRGSVDGTRSIVSSSLHTLYGFSLSPFVRYALLFLFPIPYTGLSPYSSICTSLLGAVRGTECDSEIWRHIRACLPQCFCENNIPWHEERLKGVVKWQLQTCRSSSGWTAPSAMSPSSRDDDAQHGHAASGSSCSRAAQQWSAA